MNVDKEVRDRVLMGYQRIAFGSVRDPVRLLFCEDISPRALGHMDLFNVAEIKKPKGGGLEIKFFDRIQALRCMEELGGGENVPTGFFQALEEGAKALREDEPCG